MKALLTHSLRNLKIHLNPKRQHTSAYVSIRQHFFLHFLCIFTFLRAAHSSRSLLLETQNSCKSKCVPIMCLNRDRHRDKDRDRQTHTISFTQYLSINKQFYIAGRLGGVNLCAWRVSVQKPCCPRC